MKLDTLEQHWNALGHDDPLWAILSAPDKRGGVWDLGEFLATGRRDVEEVLAQLDAHGIQLARGRALDFGCGIGRLTQPLSDHFRLCDGVDLAASMIEQATRLNPRRERCRFHHSSVSDLRMFDDASFDFVISLLVFQHMEPSLMRGYLREVVRVLNPGGVAYFNIPDRVRLGSELPGAALRARIELVGEPLAFSAAQVRKIPLKVRNESESGWPAEAEVVVGNHWLAPDGRVLVADDGRAPLGASVPPGASLDVTLKVHAPADSGDYVLEVDLLQEHRGWFGHAGSPTLRLPISVAASDGPASPGEPATADSLLVPRIEMHVLARDDAVATIEAAGGIVLDVIAKDRCGPATPSFDYIVARSPTAPTEVLTARALLDKRVDLTSFPLSSRLGPVAWLSVAGRGLLRRALLEIVARQTEFNYASSTLIHQMEREITHLHAEIDARDRVLADAHRRIESLEARVATPESLADS